jgi:2-succinyl-5-enolpyruvyl-6-hydroxy-3-cyclohexene-1-carboxylate synthase
VLSSVARARVIVDELVRCGTTDAVLCPGSRNAPLSFALQAADAAGRLRLHVRIDERTAGFLALGLAARSGRVVPVCTTSGTAVANLHPAVLEAAHAGVGLLVLSADRPGELIGTGASQTIEQPGIFGTAVRAALTAAPGASVALLRSVVDRAVAAAGAGPPGPVQLNVPFVEPLVPGADEELPAGRPDGAPWTAVPRTTRAVPPLPLDPGAPTVVVAGHGGIPVRTDAPVVAEPTAPAWPDSVRSGPWLLDRPDLRPEQVVVVGRPTLHRPVQRLLADPRVAVYAVDDGRDPQGWTDVAGAVRAVGALPELAPDADWLHRWKVADAAATAALDRALDEPTAPVGPALARALVAALPGGAQLVLGSSNPVRDVALAAVPRPGLRVLANRGVAGIDGTVSTAVGAALAHPGPSYALLGDLTLLHDTTGLVIGPDEPTPDLTIVVLNDRGGGIFHLLEQGGPEHAAAFERVFGTPHRVDLAALAAATGVPHSRPDGPTAVAAELARPARGLRLVEVTADRSDLRGAHGRLRAAVQDAVDGALAELVDGR